MQYWLTRQRKEYLWRVVVAPIIVFVFFWTTNPPISELHTLTKTTGLKSYFTQILQQIKFSFAPGFDKSLFVRNFGVVSVVRGVESSSYYIGIAGFWIHPIYWVSIPGWFVLLQVIWQLVSNHQAVMYYWVELLAVVVSFIYFSETFQQELLGIRPEHTLSLWFMMVTLLVYVISQHVLKPLFGGMLQNSLTHPAAMLYGVTCALFLYMATAATMVCSPDELYDGSSSSSSSNSGHTNGLFSGFQNPFRFSAIGQSSYAPSQYFQHQQHSCRPTFRWMQWEGNYAQGALLLVLLQLLLGHGAGFAGCVAGVLMYFAVASGFLDPLYL
jgi:hypothetical protein